MLYKKYFLKNFEKTPVMESLFDKVADLTPWCNGYHYCITWSYIKPELRFCGGLNSTLSVSEIRDSEDLWQWSRQEIRLTLYVGQPYHKNSSHHTGVLRGTIRTASDIHAVNYFRKTLPNSILTMKPHLQTSKPHLINYNWLLFT